MQRTAWVQGAVVVLLGAMAEGAAAQVDVPAPVAVPESGTPAAATGRLEVFTQPAGARVLLDGELAGVTPLTLERVAVGEHQLRIEPVLGTPVARTVFVSEGATLRLGDAPTPPATASAAASAPPASGGVLPVPGLEMSPVAPAPAKPASKGGLGSATSELVWSFITLPWAALAAAVAMGALLSAALLLTTTPSEAPFSKNLRLTVSDTVWRAGTITSVVVALVFGAITVALVLFPTGPATKLWDMTLGGGTR